MTDPHITKWRHSPVYRRYRPDSADHYSAYPDRRNSNFTPFKSWNPYSTAATRANRVERMSKLDDSDSEILIAEKLNTLHSSFEEKPKNRYGMLWPGEVYKIRKAKRIEPLAPISPVKTQTAPDKH